MRTERIHIVGAGGQARVVIDALLQSGRSLESIAVCTEDESQLETAFCGIQVEKLDFDRHMGAVFHVAIGDNRVRARLHLQMCTWNAAPVTIVHPKATVALDACVGEGSFVAAGAILGPKAIVGTACIINHAAVVDHDCSVSHFSHVAPGAILTGGVKVGSTVLIGAGAVIQPGYYVADFATVGAGSMVNIDVASNSVYVGSPARRIR